jgi:hypothetical protein
MSLGFYEKITYSAEWSDSGKEWSQIEGFLREADLEGYLATMEWRIVKNERVEA